MELLYKLIRLNSRIQSHRLKFIAAASANALGVRHLSVRLDPAMACNLRCVMCTFSGEPQHRGKVSFTTAELVRLADMFFPLALQVVVGCGAEPTLHKGCLQLVEMAKRSGVPSVGLVTNGVLLDESKLEQLKHHGLDELILSLHGVRKETYERLMVGASYEHFMQLLETVDRVRAGSGSSFSLRLNYTVCPDNLEELADFFDEFGKFRIDTFQVRPYAEIGGKYQSPGLESHRSRYDEIVRSLASTCKQRGIVFLANTSDPTFKDKDSGYSAVILDAVRRDISPDLVWREDFDWQNETYAEYCRRIGWSRHLLRMALASRSEAVRNSFYASRAALRYDVK